MGASAKPLGVILGPDFNKDFNKACIDRVFQEDSKKTHRLEEPIQPRARALLGRPEQQKGTVLEQESLPFLAVSRSYLSRPEQQCDRPVEKACVRPAHCDRTAQCR